MKRILLVFGTRPEAIKMCPLVNELKSRSEFEVLVCVTGQHLEMLRQVLDIFGVVPDYDLHLMREGQTLTDVTTGVLSQIQSVLAEAAPDLVLVHGDTTTAFATSLACYYAKIPVGHVEAGLRTHDIYSPFPEEFNRQAISLIAQYHFAPTTMARDNLLTSGCSQNNIFVTGNTVIDALAVTVREDYEHAELSWATGSRLVLFTAHRRENLGEPMRAMFRAVRRIVDEFPDVKVLYPVHPNPAVRKIARQELSGNERIHLIEQLDVCAFHNIMARAYLCLSDSGGVQEEAPAFRVPVLVMRDTTERPEGVEAGVLRLVGTGEDDVYTAVSSLLNDPVAYSSMCRASSPYGDGHASERIADILSHDIGRQGRE